MICTSLIYSLANPLIVANQATGKVKKYQAVCGTILLMILPVSYVCLKLGCPAYSVFVVHFVMESVAQLARMVMLRPLIGIRIRDYVKNIYIKVLSVAGLSVVVPLAVYLNLDGTVSRFFLVCAVCMLSVGTVAYTVGLSSNEKSFVKTRAVGFYNKVLHR